jgi:hypothetical protein
MRQHTSQLLYRYWNDVRGERMAPERFDIEPTRIAAILPETCILEQSDGGPCRFRLAGTRICDQYGYELRGTALVALATEADRLLIEEVLASITTQGAVGILELTAEAPDGRAALFEAVLLPLVHIDGAVSRYLGAISAIEAPAWLGAAVLTPGPLADHRLVWPDGRPHAVIERTRRQAPFLPELAGARIVRADRRHFRVLEGGLNGARTGKPSE